MKNVKDLQEKMKAIVKKEEFNGKIYLQIKQILKKHDKLLFKYKTNTLKQPGEKKGTANEIKEIEMMFNVKTRIANEMREMENILKPFKRKIRKVEKSIDVGFPKINIPLFLACNRITKKIIPKIIPKVAGCVLGICTTELKISSELFDVILHCVCAKTDATDYIKKFLNRSIECQNKSKTNCYNKPQFKNNTNGKIKIDVYYVELLILFRMLESQLFINFKEDNKQFKHIYVYQNAKTDFNNALKLLQNEKVLNSFQKYIIILNVLLIINKLFIHKENSSIREFLLDITHEIQQLLCKVDKNIVFAFLKIITSGFIGYEIDWKRVERWLFILNKSGLTMVCSLGSKVLMKPVLIETILKKIP